MTCQWCKISAGKEYVFPRSTPLECNCPTPLVLNKRTPSIHQYIVEGVHVFRIEKKMCPDCKMLANAILVPCEDEYGIPAPPEWRIALINGEKG